VTLCPIALAIGCRKCPAFSICPLKSTIGDYKKDEAGPAGNSAAAAKPPQDKRQ
jgi:hypothetical protein